MDPPNLERSAAAVRTIAPPAAARRTIALKTRDSFGGCFE
jgi:hypothetical protein